VYDVVDEKQYAQIVADRRAKGGDFVVDDEGLGYDENGEEDDLVMPDADREEGAEEGRGAGKRKDAAKGKGGRRHACG
jgi:DNA polymerase alpha subunit A